MKYCKFIDSCVTAIAEKLKMNLMKVSIHGTMLVNGPVKGLVAVPVNLNRYLLNNCLNYPV